MRIPILRWPGGNFVSGYDWTDGIGPREERPRRTELAWFSEESNRFGTDEFIEYCRMLGAEPYICVNMGTGTMDEAQAWVEYCNGTGDTYWANLRRENGHEDPYNVRYWGLGNEMYGEWQIGALSAEEYVRKAREFAKVMRWTDPNIELVGCGLSGLTDWDRVVIEGLAPFVDYHSIHIYTGSDDYWSNVLAPHQADRALRTTRAMIERARYERRVDHPIHVAYDEWNVWFRERTAETQLEERYNLSDALAVATYLNVFARHCETVKIANLAQMVNVIAPIFTNVDGLFLQTIYHPLKLCAEHMHEVVLDAYVECEKHDLSTEASSWPHRVADLGPFDLLDVSATCDADGRDLTLVVVNRDPEREIATTIQLAETTFRDGATAYEVTGEGPEVDQLLRPSGGRGERAFRADGRPILRTHLPGMFGHGTARRSGRVSGNMLDSSPRPPVVDTSRSPHVRLRPLPLDAVKLADDFWEPRRRINRDVTLPSQYRHLEDTGRLDNFRRASGKVGGEYQGIYFNDSDVYKWLEAAAWTLAEGSDPELERMVDTAITEVEDAQRPDGYLNTYFTFERATKRWTDFDLHEMYCAGHLFQAAVAHFRATGSERLLDVATRFADHICDTFGPEEGKRHAVDGHEEVEMALVELFRVTGERRYLEGAQYFIDARGHGLLGRPYGQHEPSYSQDHEPLRDQTEVVGHAVRALYLYAGVSDVYAETGESDLLRALERLWQNMTTRRMYVSGGLGSRYEGEAFGKDFELPNERAYTETCAAIGSVMWNWRMLVFEGEARYADLIEHTLYNAVLPGLSLDGQHYFYQNPLADDGTHLRQPWFGCACCPPNVARLLASLPGYFYSTSEGAVWVHLYAEGAAAVELEGNRTINLRQRTRYPWDGRVEIQRRSRRRVLPHAPHPSLVRGRRSNRSERRAGRRGDHPRLVRESSPRLESWRHHKHGPPDAGPPHRMPPLRHREHWTRCARARTPALLRRANRQPRCRPARPRPR